MKVFCRVTTKEMSELVKAQYAESYCCCEACDLHLTFTEEVELKTLGKYVFATIQKLRKTNNEVVWVVQKKDGHPIKQVTEDRFYRIGGLSLPV